MIMNCHYERRFWREEVALGMTQESRSLAVLVTASINNRHHIVRTSEERICQLTELKGPTAV